MVSIHNGRIQKSIKIDKYYPLTTNKHYTITSGKNGETIVLDSDTSSVVKALVCSDIFGYCDINTISPDEKYVITASYFGDLYIWALSSGLLIKKYDFFDTDTISAVSFNSNVSKIIIGKRSGMLLALEWPSFDTLIKERKALFAEAKLTLDERKLVYL